MIFNAFGIDWNANCYTKWADARYDNAYFGPAGVSVEKNKNGDTVCLTVTEADEKFLSEEINGGYYGPSPNGDVTKSLCCGELKGPAMSYGTYSWKVKLPECKHIWPALWLTGKETWPPEIDVVEGYTEDRGDYVKNCLTTKLETNAHYRIDMKNGVADNVGAKGIPWVIYKIYHREIDEYKCVWNPDGVTIYFNGVRVRKITDKNFLKCINEKALMYPIMNMMIEEGYVHDPENPPKMYVYDFKYIANNSIKGSARGPIQMQNKTRR